MSNKNLYDNYLTAHPFYSSDSLNLGGSFRFFNKNYLKFLPASKTARILDIGCGLGHFLAYVKSNNYSDFLGVDIGKEQIDHCIKHVTKKVKLITNLNAFLKENRDSFDFILMNDVIEHIEKEEVIDTLSLVLASLKKDGMVVIRTVNLKNRWGMAVRYMDFTHTAGFTEESIRQVMLTAGFRNILLVSETHPIYDIKSFIRISLKRLFEFVYRLEYIASFGAFNPMLSNMLIAVGTNSSHDEK
ncbi:MAG: class I SAM-dependent methyltransferase [Candidatus Parcubacteria bacterium]|nr:class I SAM-dependent methyltransferase [Candidatus Parcubacteria bacterium]